ncbi:uncharacterized protein DNG_02188 [Cephalotrichum gorgonifer]|uniref:HNH nuclease domain-containing protein n=1 Tax=Cephalotrichum gorgonifer TaxID=2041049 RepID=A0AAE8ST12_9PEZI|nr:uncharacterized protein DNG_02188 [Cephalotrichum gorgonifer]
MAPVHDPLPIDEVEERIKLSSQIKGDLKTFRAIDVAILMTIPLENLREAALSARQAIPFQHIRHFVRMVLQRRLKEFSEGTSLPPGPRKRKVITTASKSSYISDSDDPSYTPEREKMTEKKSKNRDQIERSKCIDRDRSSCILLGTSSPEACHIIPFAINSNQRSLTEVFGQQGFHYLWSSADPILRHKLLTDHLGCSDKVWNMISLNRQLHKWWAEPFFALKCLGIIPALGRGMNATIKLQFHWTPRRAQLQQTDPQGKGKGKDTDQHWARPVNLYNGEATNMVSDWKERRCYGTPEILSMGGIVSAADAATGRILQTGRVVELRMPLQDAEDMRAMVDLQWACVQIASMSGAAGQDDFLEDPDDDYYEDLMAVWFEQQQRCMTGERPPASRG